MQESIRLPRCPRESPLVFYTNETLKAPKTAFARRAGLENHLSTGRNLSGCKMASPSRLGRSHTTTPSRCKGFKTSMCGKTHSRGARTSQPFLLGRELTAVPHLGGPARRAPPEPRTPPGPRAPSPRPRHCSSALPEN